MHRHQGVPRHRSVGRAGRGSRGGLVPQDSRPGLILCAAGGRRTALGAQQCGGCGMRSAAMGWRGHAGGRSTRCNATFVRFGAIGLVVWPSSVIPLLFESTVDFSCSSFLSPVFTIRIGRLRMEITVEFLNRCTTRSLVNPSPKAKFRLLKL